jgi:ribose 1,5-bisphosphokinase PhnN
MTKIDERMKRLQATMIEARMRLARERMDRRTREYQRSAAARAEEAECGPGEPRSIGELSNRLMESLRQIARGDVEEMSVDEFRVVLRRRTLDS